MTPQPIAAPIAAPIAIVEPQNEGHLHAPFNAALLHTVALAWPGVPVSFTALPSHLTVVRQILTQHAPQLLTYIDWRELPPPTGTSLLARWRNTHRVFQQVLTTGERVLLTSISRMQLLQLKRWLRSKPATVRAVLHGDLDCIERPARERFPLSLLSLHRVLLQPQPDGLRYVLLSTSIRACIPAAFQPAFANAAVIDHPYHFLAPAPPTAGPVSFGIFGNTGDGHLLESVARTVKASNPGLSIRLIGSLSGPEAVARLAPYVDDAADRPIPRDVFQQRALAITHTLWLAQPGSYTLRASGTFFDTLSYAKPLVYVANPYIDSYFNLEPAIGTRCLTPDDVPAAMRHLAATFTPELYAAAQAAIYRLRQRFTPEAQSRTLPAALDWDFQNGDI